MEMTEALEQIETLVGLAQSMLDELELLTAAITEAAEELRN